MNNIDNLLPEMKRMLLKGLGTKAMSERKCDTLNSEIASTLSRKLDELFEETGEKAPVMQNSPKLYTEHDFSGAANSETAGCFCEKWDDTQLERFAKHESGQAVLCWLYGFIPAQMAVEAYGEPTDCMQHAEMDKKVIYTLDEMLAWIRVYLGGRAAEIVYYGEREGLSTLACTDLAAATDIAGKILFTYGMDDLFGPAVVQSDAAEKDAVFEGGRAAKNRILREQLAEAVQLLLANKKKLDALVEKVREQVHLTAVEIALILAETE